MVKQLPLFKKITSVEYDELNNILINAGSSLESFRYYQKRSFDVIKNHLITVLLCNDYGKNVAYGHIDYDGLTFWLGIMVIESEQGLGWGSKMMGYLTNYCDNNQIPLISLTVDKTNLNAIKLYKKYDFVVTSEFSETSLFMTRQKKLCH